MTLLLSIPEALSRCPEAAAKRKAVRSPWRIPLVDPKGQSYGYREEVNLRPGLNVLVDDYTLTEDLRVETGSGSDCAPALELEISFMISGRNRLESVEPRHNFLAGIWYEKDGGQFHWQAGERALKVDIHLEPVLLKALIGDQFAELPESLRLLVESDRPVAQRFRRVSMTTTAMYSAIQQLLNCPHEGSIRWLYWEGKVLEIIALQLAQVSGYNRQMTVDLQADDVDRIYYARDILLQRLSEPPTLLELAHLVELNDYKLKKGFRQVFNTTVFGYLTQQRMKKARQLLAAQQSIATVATEIGYTSPTAFSSAFRRQVGISPKRYQLSGQGYQRRAVSHV